MEIIKAIIMGIIQGLTEFLPVSSSGHLAILGQLLKLELDEGIIFEVLLHFGTLIAVMIAFRKDIILLIRDGLIIVKDFFATIVLGLKGKGLDHKIIDTDNKKFVMLIIVSSIPTVIMALLLDTLIESAYESLLIPGVGLLVTGGLLLSTLLFKDNTKTEKETSYLNAILIGIAQGLATLPGISRSGSTLVASLALKLNREFAIKYSFIMSIPVILGATVLKLSEVDTATITETQIIGYVLGTLASAIVGYICIKSLLIIIRKGKLHYFAYYCFLVGLLAIAGHFMI